MHIHSECYTFRPCPRAYERLVSLYEHAVAHDVLLQCRNPGEDFVEPRKVLTLAGSLIGREGLVEIILKGERERVETFMPLAVQALRSTGQTPTQSL